MKSIVVVALLPLLALAGSACRGESADDERAARPGSAVRGRVLLPRGSGSRGVEVRVTVDGADGAPRVVWVGFDERGRFAHEVPGAPIRLVVTAGGEVHRIDAADLPEADRAGAIDVGVIDLRERLVTHRLTVRATDAAAPDVVRVAMWLGPPPVGPLGEPVSLGSRQFPPVALGAATEWLLPKGEDSIYFLVERPSGPGRGTEWRSGPQRLFGPFETAGVPDELILDRADAPRAP